VILFTGGARSGKSSLALEKAESLGGKRLFVATCPVVDGEMNERIARHRRERSGRGWETRECQLELEDIFAPATGRFQVILVDCLTLWVNNILYYNESKDININDEFVGKATLRWLRASDAYPGTLICVSNEVGMGIVPDNPLARRYRDLVGTCNRLVAARASQVVLVSCGLPLNLKNKGEDGPAPAGR